MSARTISEVITQLEAIVARATETGDPLGLFALLYLEVTRDVAVGIEQNRFTDGRRMERLDVYFANRYLVALGQFRRGEPCTKAWETAFLAAQQQNLLVLQHLLMGMNAHINLDLGIAAAESVEALKIKDLEGDFMEINRLLSAKIDAVQAKLGAVSPLLFLIDWLGKTKDEQFAEFSLVQARKHAWRVALRLAGLLPEARPAAIAELDHYVAALNRLLMPSGRWLGTLVRVIKRFEQKDVKRVLAALQAP